MLMRLVLTFLLPFSSLFRQFLPFLLDLWGLHGGLGQVSHLETGRISGINWNNGEKCLKEAAIARGSDSPQHS